MKNNDFVSVQLTGGMHGVFALVDCDIGTVVRNLLVDDVADRPTRTSIHIGNGRHVEDAIGIYINHSCTPSCKIVGSSVIAIDKLKKGDEITFNYNESELVVSSPFRCLCCGCMIGAGQ